MTSRSICRTRWDRGSTTGKSTVSGSRKATRSPRASATTTRPATSSGSLPTASTRSPMRRCCRCCSASRRRKGLSSAARPASMLPARSPRQGIGAGAHRRHDPCRFRRPLSVKAVQPGLSQGTLVADPTLAGEMKIPSGRTLYRPGLRQDDTGNWKKE